ncbi:MAG: sigma-54-dependent Fis family transcriptional regulator [Rhodospirillales bacterium]|nr:sigma-54-dependent Fis family transcriptional regulator [Rhodospirillales bacterium]
MSADILIVDDEADIRAWSGNFEDESYTVREAASCEQAYAAVAKKTPALVVLDIWLQGSKDDGLGNFTQIEGRASRVAFVMISGHGTIETAVSAIKDGAYDFIEKPFKSDRLLMMIARALETAHLRRENASLKKRSFGQADQLIGKSAAVQKIQQLIERVAPTNSRILIQGEAGTGKDVIARLIHSRSQRANEAFMTINCATLLPERLEIELFGREAGVNGKEEHIGILEQAHGGTLVLDEVADMPLETQGKIVHTLQEQSFQRIGGQSTIETDVRILATTNRDLEAAIKAGAFREDLYYRLNVVQIEAPALRERREDIAALAEGLLQEQLQLLGREGQRFSSAAVNALKAYDWPGNVRQLKNVIEWVCIMYSGQGGEMLGIDQLPPEVTGKHGAVDGARVAGGGGALEDDYLELSLREAREAFEKEYLLAQVARFDGNISKTAQFIGMERSALHRKLKSLQIHSDALQEQDDPLADPAVNRKRA